MSGKNPGGGEANSEIGTYDEFFHPKKLTPFFALAHKTKKIMPIFSL